MLKMHSLKTVTSLIVVCTVYVVFLITTFIAYTIAYNVTERIVERKCNEIKI
jgi:hypothetical protein